MATWMEGLPLSTSFFLTKPVLRAEQHAGSLPSHSLVALTLPGGLLWVSEWCLVACVGGVSGRWLWLSSPCRFLHVTAVLPVCRAGGNAAAHVASRLSRVRVHIMCRKQDHYRHHPGHQSRLTRWTALAGRAPIQWHQPTAWVRRRG